MSACPISKHREFLDQTTIKNTRNFLIRCGRGSPWPGGGVVRALGEEEHSLAWKSSRNPMAPEIGCRGPDLSPPSRRLSQPPENRNRDARVRGATGGRGRKRLAGRRGRWWRCESEIPFLQISPPREKVISVSAWRHLSQTDRHATWPILSAHSSALRPARPSLRRPTSIIKPY